ncbi:MAG: glutamate-5-semialdehyde dehydrogenase [Nitrospiraceae bacterium]|jgi:glutamate-5-semialdehyde dehydrogenase|nr:glutamate-5-semialdehyde dehydrogenase [Nitrospiraceae bacterium]
MLEQTQPYTQEALSDGVSRARRALGDFSLLSSRKKNEVLIQLAEALLDEKADILSVNQADYQKAVSSGLDPAMCDRLLLTDSRFAQMVAGLRDVAALPDPVGTGVSSWENADGLKIEKIRVPLGLVGVIYEARPNVTVEVFSLCLKAGCPIVLKGGSEAFNTNMKLVGVVKKVLALSGVNVDGVFFLPWTDRNVVIDLVENTDLDVIIPRGGAGLMDIVTRHSRVPVLRHDRGLCHIYVGASADEEMALSVVLNAKTSRPSTCNSMETLLVDARKEAFLWKFLAICHEKGIRVMGCPVTRGLDPTVEEATHETYNTEFLDLTLNCRVVDGIDTALSHIRKFGSGHTEAIITSDVREADRFWREVDASCVMVNASTRLHDGFAFGLGAEVGISTTRIHARGTMGLAELTTTKYQVWGNGHLRKS